MDVRSMFDKEFLYHFDLQGRDVTVTIRKVVQGAVQGTDGKKQKKPVVYFDKATKALAMNITNVRTVGGMYGFTVAEWIGKRITLYATTTQMAGKTVECIRIRPTVPGAKVADGKLEDVAPPAEREAGGDDDHEAVA